MATGCKRAPRIQRAHSLDQDLVEQPTLAAEMLLLLHSQSIHPESQDRAARSFLVRPTISMLHQHLELVNPCNKQEEWEKAKDD